MAVGLPDSVIDEFLDFLEGKLVAGSIEPNVAPGTALSMTAPAKAQNLMKYPIRFPFLLSFILLPLTLGGRAEDSRAGGYRSVADRIANRSYPSIFQAWNPADNLADEDPLVTAARHDLIFHGASFYGLVWDNANEGLATGFTPESLADAPARRDALMRLNPNLILIMEIRYRDAREDFLGAGHGWWRRDENDELVMGWEEGGFIQMDYSNPDFRGHVARRAAAAIASGAVDGIMLDWWDEDEDRLALVRTIREQIGSDALILVNANDREIPMTAAYINGLFMECYRSGSAAEWSRIENTLIWAEAHLRAPRINCLETWFHHSRSDLDLMRATTTLVLTRSEGYALFSDPNPLPKPDHLHDWYDFWDADAGVPVAAGETWPDGSVRRSFSNGMVVYNRMGNPPVAVRFERPMFSVATGQTSVEHEVPSSDGDIFLKSTDN
ncbi:MAG: hypothetical protein R3F07_18815 [Opitutaceae bacterium]